MTDITTLLLEQNVSEYAPVPFWSWNNSLDREELLRQIDDMKAVGCGGFIIHARTGLRTEYLSEEWFYLTETCLEAARERGMQVWIYDENGWPSGFAGGELLKEEKYLAQYLELTVESCFHSEAFAVFAEAGGEYRRIMTAQKGVSVYYTVYRRYSPSNTNILNPEVVERFIAITHEEYYRRFSARFGRELAGFFTDEPQFFRGKTPYAPALAEYWQKEFGEDVRDGLIALFRDGEQYYPFRVKFYTALNKLYTETYYRRIYEWCERHRCKLTGHSIEENKFFAQMWGSAGVSPSYYYEHIPAIDHLALGNSAKLSARQVYSVAAQTGKKRILTETFGCCGYAATPRQLKAIAEKQYVHGVNMLCHHLYPYSLAGQGKTDHPPCFGRQITWHDEFPSFNLYFSRLGYLLANSDAQVKCVVISPMSSVYLRYGCDCEQNAMDTDEAFERLQKTLNRYAIEYEIADEYVMRKSARVAGRQLCVGLRRYVYVIVPDCANLSSSTKLLLRQYAESGGKILAFGRPRFTDGLSDDWSFLRSNVTCEEIAKNRGIRLETDGRAEFTYRKGNGFRFLYLVNPEDGPSRVRLPKGWSRLDLLSLRKDAVSDFVLAAGEGAVFVPGKGRAVKRYLTPIDISAQMKFLASDDNNLTLDYARTSFDGKNYGEEQPLAAMFDRLLREEYCGKLYLAFSFTARLPCKKLILRREKGAYISSSLNGKRLSFHQSLFDVMFEEADVAALVKQGNNEYVCELDFYERPQVFYALFSPQATESMRNCLSYDTELENIYLLGDFSVNRLREIYPFDPPVSACRLENKGFPNFAGAVSFSVTVFGKSSAAKLVLYGIFSAAEIFINGICAGSCFEQEGVELPLRKGEENTLVVKIFSTLRNMFGPFHWTGSENAVSPYQFTMRGAWKNGSCAEFDPSYRLQPFGIDRAELSFAEEVENDD